MGLERYLDSDIGAGKTVDLVAAATLAPYEQAVRVVPAEAITITLPLVAEAMGKIFSILVRIGATHNVTVVDQGDSDIAVSDVHAATPSFSVYYSDGLNWFILAQTLT